MSRLDVTAECAFFFIDTVILGQLSAKFLSLKLMYIFFLSWLYKYSYWIRFYIFTFQWFIISLTEKPQ